MRFYFCIVLIVLCFVFSSICIAAKSPNLDFTLIKLGNGPRAVLVIGGIQGDEPGGFSAATLLGTRYSIQEGSVWVVPNLNFPSIIRRARGVHGDMNRKFLKLDDNDPEYFTVNRIQGIINSPDVSLVLNLHDGSGFYRPTYQNSLCNPKRWGQSVIIDQENIDENLFMYALSKEAEQVVESVNRYLLKPLHIYHVYNTRTSEGNKEMEKSLSYYAMRKGKAAFGLEASKEFSVSQRVYYHLHLIEAFLNQANISFSRDFELTPKGVEEALQANLGVTFADNRIFLPLEDIRSSINYFPMPKDGISKAVTSKPIMAVLPCQDKDKKLCVHYGNRIITEIIPEWREIDNTISSIRVSLDGKDEDIKFGQMVDINQSIKIYSKEGYRVNAIGFDSGKKDESGIFLKYRDFETRFSVDRRGTIFRVEVYKNQNFSGMFLVRFNKKNARNMVMKNILPDSPGFESSLGF